MEQKKNSGIRIMTRKERYEYLVREVGTVQHELRTANTEETINKALEKLSKLADGMCRDIQLADVNDWFTDIQGTICAVKLHDCTRSTLDELLNLFLEGVRKIITEENKKENEKKLKLLFEMMAENADKIAEMIDTTKIFG